MVLPEPTDSLPVPLLDQQAYPFYRHLHSESPDAAVRLKDLEPRYEKRLSTMGRYLGEMADNSSRDSLSVFLSHAQGAEVQIEEGTFFPISRFDQTVILFKPFIKRGAWERGQNSDLHFIEFRYF